MKVEHYLIFEDKGLLSKNAKTRKWVVLAHNKILGGIKWYPPWRRYAFFPAYPTLYEQDCLREIADFIEAETRKRKEERSRG